MHGILQVCCPDQRGLVAQISQFVHYWGGNIVHADHHLDEGLFLSRLEWELAGFNCHLLRWARNLPRWLKR